MKVKIINFTQYIELNKFAQCTDKLQRTNANRLNCFYFAIIA